MFRVLSHCTPGWNRYPPADHLHTIHDRNLLRFCGIAVFPDSIDGYRIIYQSIDIGSLKSYSNRAAIFIGIIALVFDTTRH